MPEKEFKSIKNWLNEDKPREKLQNKGAVALTNAELLAILINTGTKNASALDIAKEVLQLANNKLFNFQNLSLEQLKKIKGLGAKKALTLMAALELGKRIRLEPGTEKIFIKSSIEAYPIFLENIDDWRVEQFQIIMLSNSNQFLKLETISKGGTSSTIVDPKILFNKAMNVKGATKIILAHNHPSGILSPSTADELITKKLIDGALLLELKIVDHIIIGENSYYSFLEHDLLFH